MTNRFLLFSGLSFLLLGCQPDPETAPATEPYIATAPDIFFSQKVPADNPTTVQGVELGRFLFYEKKLSGNNTISCGSCHQQKFAFTDGGKALSPGAHGSPGKRNTMSLANIGWATDLNWDAKAKTLEEQARLPIQDALEMHQNFKVAVARLQNTDMYPPLFLKAFGSKEVTEDRIVKALAQFQRTLISANSDWDKKERGELALSQDAIKGRLLFKHTTPGGERGAHCEDCHGNAGLFTKPKVVNNGLDLQFKDPGLGGVTGNSGDMGKFKVPTLRNVALTAPYMHDGRFKTLEEVLDHYNEHVEFNSPNISSDMFGTNLFGPPPQKLGLTTTEKRQIIAFLHALTDSTFLADGRFSDPFVKK